MAPGVCAERARTSGARWGRVFSTATRCLARARLARPTRPQRPPEQVPGRAAGAGSRSGGAGAPLLQVLPSDSVGQSGPMSTPASSQALGAADAMLLRKEAGATGRRGASAGSTSDQRVPLNYLAKSKKMAVLRTPTDLQPCSSPWTLFWRSLRTSRAHAATPGSGRRHAAPPRAVGARAAPRCPPRPAAAAQ